MTVFFTLPKCFLFAVRGFFGGGCGEVCHTGCGILVSDKGLKLCALQWEHGVFPWTAREVPSLSVSLLFLA